MKKLNNKLLSIPFIIASIGPLISCGSNNADENNDINISSMVYRYDETNHYQRFWDNPEVIYNESITFVEQSDGKVQGRLYYNVDEILCIKDYNLEKNLDLSLLSVKDNILTIKNPTLDTTDKNAISYFTYDNYQGDIKSLSANPFLAHVGVANIGENKNILHTEDIGIARMHYYVTYKRKASSIWKGGYPKSSSSHLSNTISKLMNKEKINIVFNGSSIVTGAMSSGFLNEQRTLHPERYSSNVNDDYLKVNEPYYSKAFKNELERLFGYTDSSLITVTNTARGGYTSRWAKDYVDREINAYNPDLVIVGYGTNDGSLYGGKYLDDENSTELTGYIKPEDFKSNIQSIINQIRDKNANANIILIHAIKPNPESPVHCHKQNLYIDVFNDIVSSYDGVTLLNMYEIMEELYTKKLAIDMLANNINHPNDWLEREHVAAFLSLFNDNGYFIDTPKGLSTKKENNTLLFSGFDKSVDKKVSFTEKIKLDGLSFELGIENPTNAINGQNAGFFFSKDINSNLNTNRETATIQYVLSPCKYNVEQDRFSIFQHVIDSFDFISGDGSIHPRFGDKTYYINRESWNGKSGFAPVINCNDLVITHNPNNDDNFKLKLKFEFSLFSNHIYKLKISETAPNSLWKDNSNYYLDNNNVACVITYIDDSYLPLDEKGETYLHIFGYHSNNADSPLISYKPLNQKYIFFKTTTSKLVDDFTTISNYGSLIEKPVDPTLEGFEFVGWYKDVFYTYAWDFENDVVKEDTILYARWVENGSEIPELVYENNEKNNNDIDADIVKKADKTLVKEVYQINWVVFVIIIAALFLGLAGIIIGIIFLFKYMKLQKRAKEILK